MTTRPLENRIASLIRLIDDRDEYVRNRIQDELVSIGEDAIPFLEIAVKDENLLRRASAQKALQAIFPIHIKEQFLRLSQGTEDINLEAGVFLLMQFGYPESEPETYKKILDDYACEIGNRVKPNAPPFEIIKTLTDFLFHEQGYKGNEENYFAEDNTYLNQVLKHKIGIPITLSTLCIFIGQRIGQPIYGVGMPCHFIVKYHALEEPLFFDPFNKGRILTYQDCVDMVQGFGLKFEDHFLIQSSNREILIRMMNNLIIIYKQGSAAQKADQLGEYAQLISHRPKIQKP